jgi:DNA polymerase-1
MIIKYISKQESLFTKNKIEQFNSLEPVVGEILSLAYQHGYIAVDTETEGFFDFVNRIVMFQLCIEDNCYVIDARTIDISPLYSLLVDKQVTKLLWNCKFDYKFIKRDYGIELENCYDGFLAELTINCGIQGTKYDLGSAALKYLDIKLNKDIRNKFVGLNGAPFTESQILYGAEDVYVLNKIRQKQLIALTKYDLLPVLEVENEAILALADIEYNGLPFNKDKWIALANIAIEKTADIQDRLDTLVYSNPKLRKYHSGSLSLFEDIKVRVVNIDYTSPKQSLDLFRRLGYELNGVGEPELRKYSKDEFVKLFLEYSQASKLKTAFGLDFLKYINKETGRIHTDIWPIKDTHRISSANPNLQQIPAKKEYLACFECLSGYYIVSIDFSG